MPSKIYFRRYNEILKSVMNKEDRAIVVGVSDYPDLAELKGPEKDAKAFYDWLIKETGGDVPPENIRLIKTSDFDSERPFTKATYAKPTTQRVEEAFDELDDISRENDKRGDGVRVGRRLYLYFSGHGIAPSLVSAGHLPQFDDAALLMANATKGRFAHHITGKPWANLYFKNGYFDEVILFMDCCRDYFPNIPLNFVKHEDSTTYRELDESKLLYGFATKWNRLAREKVMEDGKTFRGVFTLALIAGLEGAASDPVTGLVTARTLCNYVRQNMERYFDPAVLKNGDISREPVFRYCDESGDNLVFAQFPVQKFPVKIHLPDKLKDKRIEIQRVRKEIPPIVKIIENPSASQTWEFEIERGLYQAIAGDGSNILFEVVGKINADGTKEVENVEFK